MLIIKRIRIILFVENQKQSPEVFHKNILNSQVKTCFEVSFLKGLQPYLKRNFDASVCLWILQQVLSVFNNIYIEEHIRMAAFGDQSTAHSWILLPWEVSTKFFLVYEFSLFFWVLTNVAFLELNCISCNGCLIDVQARSYLRWKRSTYFNPQKNIL